jgi:hypothetical protein
MTDFPRLIEHAFPLKQASLDNVHQKNVRHGHISTLHMWPARRPLAAGPAVSVPRSDPYPEDLTAWLEAATERGGEENMGPEVRGNACR